jgi:hypothetical protein
MYRYSCQIFIKIKFSRQILKMYLNAKFDENPSSRNWGVSCGRTDRQTDMIWYDVDYSSFFVVLRHRPPPPKKTIRFRRHSILQSTDATKHLLYITTVTRLTHCCLWHLSETKFMEFTGITKIDYRLLLNRHMVMLEAKYVTGTKKGNSCIMFSYLCQSLTFWRRNVICFI